MEQVREIEVSSLRVNESDGRVSPEEVAELAASMIGGLHQPLVVRPVAAKAKTPGHWEVVAGRRRLAAARVLQWVTVPCIVREMDDAKALEVRIVENDQRADIHPMDQAASYGALLKELGVGATAANVSARIGRSEAHVRDRLRLLGLSKEAREHFRANRLSLAVALALSRVPQEAQRRALDPEHGGVFRTDNALLFQDDEKDLAPRTLAEVQDWIDTHVRLDVEAKNVVELFPEAAPAVEAAAKKENVVEITTEHFVQPEARDADTRTIGPRSWRRADGKEKSKTCEHSVLGVVVVGDGRGQAFQVCTAKKKCKVHWRDEIKSSRKIDKAAATKEAARLAKLNEARKREDAEREVRSKAWSDAKREIEDAIVAAAKTLPVSKIGAYLASHYGRNLRPEHKPGPTADSVLRWFLANVLNRSATGWSADRDFPITARALGIKLPSSVVKAPAKKAPRR